VEPAGHLAAHLGDVAPFPSIISTSPAMSPQDILEHANAARLWSGPGGFADLDSAYQCQLAVSRLRQARGESVRGYKIGFTNRGIWPRYRVNAPIWGPVWDSTLSFCEGGGQLDLGATCQPRIEPECVLGFARTPPPQADEQAIYDCLDWVASGFEIVQSHQAHWQFTLPDIVADGGLHARLLVGRRVPVRAIAASGAQLEAALAGCPVTLRRDDEVIDQGQGSAVLGGPLAATAFFLRELRACPGARDLQGGDVLTTGTWTDAWAVKPGERWTGEFGQPLLALSLRLI